MVRKTVKKSIKKRNLKYDSDNETSQTDGDTDIFDSEINTEASVNTDTDTDTDYDEKKEEKSSSNNTIKPMKPKKETKIAKRDPDDEKNFLKELCIDNNIKLSNNILDELVNSYYYESDNYIFDRDPEISMNIIYIIANDGKSEDEIIDYIRSCKNRKEILFGQLCMINAKANFEFEFSAQEKLKDVGVVREDIKCSNCENNKIIVTKQQLRSADEGTTILYRCPKCGNGWRRN